MPVFICQGRYSREAIQAMIAKPEDRAEAVRALVEARGGKLLGFYLTFGPKDFLAIVEAPNDIDAAAVSLAVSASGAVASFETTLAMTSAEAKEAFARAPASAAAYRPPGKA